MRYRWRKVSLNTDECVQCSLIDQCAAPTKAQILLNMIGKESVTGIGRGMISWLADGLKVEEAQWVGPIEIMFTLTELSILQTTIESFCKDMWEIGYTDRKD